jgi:hypothetical protein
MTAPAAPRGIEALDVSVADVLESLRTSLPATDPDRHALDTAADDRFAHLVPGYPGGPQGVTV